MTDERSGGPPQPDEPLPTPQYQDYVGGKYLAADGSNYGIYILELDEKKSDFIVVALVKGKVDEAMGLCRLDCFKASYRYELDASVMRDKSTEEAIQEHRQRVLMQYVPDPDEHGRCRCGCRNYLVQAGAMHDECAVSGQLVGPGRLCAPAVGGERSK